MPSAMFTRNNSVLDNLYAFDATLGLSWKMPTLDLLQGERTADPPVLAIARQKLRQLPRIDVITMWPSVAFAVEQMKAMFCDESRREIREYPRLVDDRVIEQVRDFIADLALVSPAEEAANRANLEVLIRLLAAPDDPGNAAACCKQANNLAMKLMSPLSTHQMRVAAQKILMLCAASGSADSIQLLMMSIAADFPQDARIPSAATWAVHGVAHGIGACATTIGMTLARHQDTASYAAHMFILGARLGDRQGMALAASCFLNGWGVPVSLIDAHALAANAWNLGSPLAQTMLPEIFAMMYGEEYITYTHRPFGFRADSLNLYAYAPEPVRCVWDGEHSARVIQRLVDGGEQEIAAATHSEYEVAMGNALFERMVHHRLVVDNFAPAGVTGTNPGTGEPDPDPQSAHRSTPVWNTVAMQERSPNFGERTAWVCDIGVLFSAPGVLVDCISAPVAVVPAAKGIDAVHPVSFSPKYASPTHESLRPIPVAVRPGMVRADTSGEIVSVDDWDPRVKALAENLIGLSSTFGFNAPRAPGPGPGDSAEVMRVAQRQRIKIDVALRKLPIAVTYLRPPAPEWDRVRGGPPPADFDQSKLDEEWAGRAVALAIAAKNRAAPRWVPNRLYGVHSLRGVRPHDIEEGLRSGCRDPVRNSWTVAMLCGHLESIDWAKLPTGRGGRPAEQRARLKRMGDDIKWSSATGLDWSVAPPEIVARVREITSAYTQGVQRLDDFMLEVMKTGVAPEIGQFARNPGAMEILALIEKAARGAHRDAMYLFGQLLRVGFGREADASLGVAFVMGAAIHGHLGAVYVLGGIHGSGVAGFPRPTTASIALSKDLLHFSARYAMTIAQYSLARSILGAPNPEPQMRACALHLLGMAVAAGMPAAIQHVQHMRETAAYLRAQQQRQQEEQQRQREQQQQPRPAVAGPPTAGALLAAKETTPVVLRDTLYSANGDVASDYGVVVYGEGANTANASDDFGILSQSVRRPRDATALAPVGDRPSASDPPVLQRRFIPPLPLRRQRRRLGVGIVAAARAPDGDDENDSDGGSDSDSDVDMGAGR